MPPLTRVKHLIVALLPVLLLGSSAYAQPSLSLASGTALKGGALSLNLSLNAATSAPAGLQWTLAYSPNDISSLSAAAGPALTSAGKTLNCNAGTGSVICLASGMNANAIGSGVVAVVTANLNPASSSGLDSVPMSNTMGAAADGTSLSVSGTGGSITVTQSNPVPAITSLSPASTTAGAAAFTLTVNGSGFINGSVVRWNGSNRTTTFVSATQVKAAITAADIATAGTAQVSVFNPAPGGGTSGAVAFTITAANPVPTISSLAPVSATAGGAAFTLTVNGTGFVNGAVVNWNGTSRTTTFVSAMQVKAAITAADIATAGTAQVSVFNPTPGGGTSGNAAFTITASNPLPTISSLSPAIATAGGAAFTLTVNGTGFVNGAVVRWNGSNRTTTFVSATQLQAAIAAADIASAGTAQVTVFNPTPGGGTSGIAAFTIIAPNPVPTISSLAPANILAGGLTFTLTVNGAGFVPGSVVNWNGTSRTTTYVSATQLQAAITALDILTAGIAQVTVFNPAPGGGTSGGASFTISAPNPVPTISSLSPANAMAGGAAFTLTVNGTGFVNGAVVNWNGTSRTTTFVSATLVKAAITAADIASAGTGQVTVFNPAPGGGTSGALAFTITAPNPVPTISSLSPASATAGGVAFTLTVNGTGFIAGSVVNWNGTSRATTFVSATQVKASITTADIATAGTAQMTVFNPAPGGGTSGNAAFTIIAPNPIPTISSLAPSSATAGGAAFTLMVNGTGFVNGAVVNWNGTSRVTTFVSATQLQAAIAAADIASVGTAQVTVFNPAPGGGTSGSAAFTIIAPNPVPTISSLAPSSATAGGTTFTLTVNGMGFVAGAVVNWNGTSRATTFVSATQVQAAIAAADIANAGTGQVTVFNPAPGGGTSGAVAFTITAPNPVPTISSLAPASATAGGAAFTLTVNGTGFVNGAVVNWNGTSRTTTFVSATQVQAVIAAADIVNVATTQVTVFNPTPGGGTSGNAAFTITAANPVPTISSLSPSSTTASGAAFTLTVNGTGFVNGAVVNWNGASRTTTYVSATQVKASITATDIATAGTAQVTVFNPTPGGGTSSAATFTINNPAPTISSQSPSSATAGGAAFTLTVNGTGFITGSVVNWNGASRTTTYVSATQVKASITATDIATAGTPQVTVFNPTPGGGTSSAATFTINASNPVPTISSLSPASAAAGGAAFTLTINGTGFVNGSVVRWSGSNRTTTFVSSTQLQAAITASDISKSGTKQVTVFNPTPGGGTSGNTAFTINSSNPAPTISSLSPASATAGGAAFTLTVIGSGFITGSVVNWNGTNRTTTYVSATQIKASIMASDIATAGTAQVTVFNPAPGGGTSGNAAFTILAPNQIPTGLVTAYSLDENTGTAANDTSGFGNTATLVNGPTWVLGKYGAAVSFDGVGDYLIAPDSPSLDIGNSGAIEAWVKFAALQRWHGIIAKGNDNVDSVQNYAVELTAANRFLCVVGNGQNQTLLLSNTTVLKNQFYHITCDWTGSSIQLYVNGTLDASTAQTFMPAANTSPLYIGQYGGNTDRFQGVIDEVRIYNRTLSQAEIQRDMTTAISSYSLAPSAITATTLSMENSLAPSPSSSELPEPGASTGEAPSAQNHVSSLSCSPRMVTAGDRISCALRTTARSTTRIQLASSSGLVKVPALLESRPNQTLSVFQALVDPLSQQQVVTLTATLEGSPVVDSILVVPASTPILTVPGKQFAKFGTTLSFQVNGVDPTELGIQLSVGNLPPGATFEKERGRFVWTPKPSQAGTYHVTFSAINADHRSSTAQVEVDVDSGRPVLTSLENSACSAGAIGRLRGKWLVASGDTFADSSGTALEWGGTRVKMNGESVPIIAASATEIRFLCPELPSGLSISTTVETPAGVSVPGALMMRPASPEVFVISDWSGGYQGMISFGNTTQVATNRDFRIAGYPAQPGDEVMIWGTGFGSAQQIADRRVTFGGTEMNIESLRAVPGHKGVYTIQGRIPASVSSGDAVPVQIQIVMPNGEQFKSNTVTTTIEVPSQ